MQVAGESVRVGPSSANSRGRTGGDCNGQGEPDISPERDADGFITAIRVTCSCGREIVIDCQHNGEMEDENGDV